MSIFSRVKSALLKGYTKLDKSVGGVLPGGVSSSSKKAEESSSETTSQASGGYSRFNPVTGKGEYVLPSGAVVAATPETTAAIEQGKPEIEVIAKSQKEEKGIVSTGGRSESIRQLKDQERDVENKNQISQLEVSRENVQGVSKEPVVASVYTVNALNKKWGKYIDVKTNTFTGTEKEYSAYLKDYKNVEKYQNPINVKNIDLAKSLEYQKQTAGFSKEEFDQAKSYFLQKGYNEQEAEILARRVAQQQVSPTEEKQKEILKEVRAERIKEAAADLTFEKIPSLAREGILLQTLAEKERQTARGIGYYVAPSLDVYYKKFDQGIFLDTFRVLPNLPDRFYKGEYVKDKNFKKISTVSSKDVADVGSFFIPYVGAARIATEIAAIGEKGVVKVKRSVGAYGVKAPKELSKEIIGGIETHPVESGIELGSGTIIIGGGILRASRGLKFSRTLKKLEEANVSGFVFPAQVNKEGQVIKRVSESVIRIDKSGKVYEEFPLAIFKTERGETIVKTLAKLDADQEYLILSEQIVGKMKGTSAPFLGVGYVSSKAPHGEGIDIIKYLAGGKVENLGEGGVIIGKDKFGKVIKIGGKGSLAKGISKNVLKLNKKYRYGASGLSEIATFNKLSEETYKTNVAGILESYNSLEEAINSVYEYQGTFNPQLRIYKKAGIKIYGKKNISGKVVRDLDKTEEELDKAFELKGSREGFDEALSSLANVGKKNINKELPKEVEKVQVKEVLGSTLSGAKEAVKENIELSYNEVKQATQDAIQISKTGIYVKKLGAETKSPQISQQLSSEKIAQATRESEKATNRIISSSRGRAKTASSYGMFSTATKLGEKEKLAVATLPKEIQRSIQRTKQVLRQARPGQVNINLPKIKPIKLIKPPPIRISSDEKKIIQKLKKQQKKEKRKRGSAYTGTILSAGFGITEELSEEEVKKLQGKEFTGFEVRPLIKIRKSENKALKKVMAPQKAVDFDKINFEL